MPKSETKLEALNFARLSLTPALSRWERENLTNSETSLTALNFARLSLSPTLSRPAVLAHRRGRWERIHEPPRLTNGNPEPRAVAGRVTPGAPPPRWTKPGAPGVTRPTWRFMGRENGSPSLSEAETDEFATNSSESGSGRPLFPLPPGEGERYERATRSQISTRQ